MSGRSSRAISTRLRRASSSKEATLPANSVGSPTSLTGNPISSIRSTCGAHSRSVRGPADEAISRGAGFGSGPISGISMS